MHGAKDAVQLQIQRGTDVNAADDHGRTALTLAVEKGHRELCQLLLDAGADPELYDANGNGPLSVAIKLGLSDIEALLRQHLTPSRPRAALEASAPVAARPSSPDTLFPEVSPIPRGDNGLLDDTSCLSLWEEEAETPRPEGDATCIADARQLQELISTHELVDADEDWSEVDIDLPQLLEFSRGSRRRWEDERDWQNAARQLFLAGIRNGFVREAELIRSVPPDEEDWDAPDQEHLAAIRIVLGEIDVHVLDAPDDFAPLPFGPGNEIPDDITPDNTDELLADEGLIFLSSLHSYTNDPLTQYVKDIGSAKVLSREEEIDLACEISVGIKGAFRSVPRSSVAMRELLDWLKRAERGDVPIKSIIGSIGNMNNMGEDTNDEESLNLVDHDESDDDNDYNIQTPPSVETQFASNIPADLHDKFESIRTLYREMTSAQSVKERESLADKLSVEIQDLGISTNFMDHLWRHVESDDSSPKAREMLARGLSHARTARNMFAIANLKLVMWVARRYGGMTYIDRVQEGNIGLLKAIDRFDPSYGARFSTYAIWWIRQSILRALADKGRLIRLPVHIIDTRKKIQSASNSLESRLRNEPTTEELAREVDIPEHLVKRILRVPEDPIPLLSLEDTEQNIAENFSDFVTQSPEDIAMHVSLREALDESLQCLTQREADVIRLRFGLDDDKDHTLEQIGQIYGVTRERIRQIEAKALRKLVHRARTDKLKVFLE